MITIVAKHIIKEDQTTAFMNLAKELIAETRKETGNINYNLFQDTTHKNTLTFIEEWESKEAIDLHFNSSHFTRIVPQIKPLLTSAPEINLYQILD